MKKKILVSLILAVILVLATLSCFATDAEINLFDENVDNEVMTTSEIEDLVTEQIEIASKESFNNSYFDAGEKVVLENKIVMGNVLIAAGTIELKNVTVDGDVFMAGNNITIDSSSVINGNVFVAGNNLVLNGEIDRDLYAAGKEISFSSTAAVMYETYLGAEHIVLDGSFYRDVNASITDFEIGDNAKIFADLNYTSEEEVEIPENAIIVNTNFSKLVEEKKSTLDIIYDVVMDCARYFALTMVLFIIIFKFFPSLIEKSRKNLAINSFGIGILTLIITPILAFAFIFTDIFANVAFVLIALFVTVMMISNTIANIALAKLISEKKENIKLPISVACVSVVTWIIYQIPYVGAVCSFIWLITGLGIMVKNIIKK